MERLAILCLIFIVTAASTIGITHGSCDDSMCYSLQNKLDNAPKSTKEQIKHWCEVAVPYTLCLEGLSADCNTNYLHDVIDYTQQLMKSYDCGSSAVKITTLLLFVSLVLSIVIKA